MLTYNENKHRFRSSYFSCGVVSFLALQLFVQAAKTEGPIFGTGLFFVLLG
jgi:hypothetical protein